MAKNIVFDLEGVIKNFYSTINELHPQAEEVLKRARNDFDNTYLWSYVKFDKCFDFLTEKNVIDYFDFILGPKLEGREVYYPVFSVRENKEVKRLPIDIGKDLSKLGNPKEFVLIDDLPELGLPENRVIHPLPYVGQPNHSLIIPYEQALKMF
jgi:hypothetical protein